MLEKLLRFLKMVIPRRLFVLLRPVYHWLLAFFAALFYCFPSRKIFVLGVVGTKGKTSTIEIINTILEQAGYKTALMSSLRFKTGRESEKNLYKMTMPGRFFIQRFLREAVNEKCQYAILEMTSEGAIQYRHKFIKLDALIFTNLSPEHIEAHGSFGNYKNAKLSIFKALEKSRAKRKIIIINGDDPSARFFINFKSDEKIIFGLKNVSAYKLEKDGIIFTVDGAEIKSKLSGEFNLYNILAAIAFIKSQAIDINTIKNAIEKFSGIEGRMESINEGQDFKIIVDYAHTSDSLEKVYEVFQTSKKICVLGATGGGRDKWKRPEMGKIASKYCDNIILTNEDPYDDDPRAIIEDIAKGISKSYKIILDRREAITDALKSAKTGDAVIITGKGAEPWIMGPKGMKTPWDDREVCKEELIKLMKS